MTCQFRPNRAGSRFLTVPIDRKFNAEVDAPGVPLEV
jgi:hypothetical protein